MATRKGFQRRLAKLAKTIMKSQKYRIPKYDMPIRLRPWFLVFTCIVMVSLAFLGFTNLHEKLPLPDKIMHFLCFFLATGVFYFIIDVEESARRIWFWRHSGVIFTVFTCMLCGGILSEFVQAALPYKELELGDILANLAGSALGLWISFHLERYYRHRREIARLYQPLSASMSEYDELEEEEEEYGNQLLPTHANHGKAKSQKVSLANVWDEREELFGIGDDSDDEGPQPGASNIKPQTPRIVVTSVP